MRISYSTALALLALALAPATGARSAVSRSQIETSMRVPGSIEVSADGRVLGYALDTPDALPPSVRELAQQSVPGWTFEPVALDPGTSFGRARMSLLVVARKREDGAIVLRVGAVSFGGDGDRKARSAGHLVPPTYPRNAASAGVGGSVYTAVHVDREGRVVDVMTEQVNLFVVGREKELAAWRDVLAQTTLRTARTWRFEPPEGTPEPDGMWTYRVPVDFIAPGWSMPQPGKWQAYVPGPRTPVPWYGHRALGAPDALAGGAVYPAEGMYRLRTPLDSSL